MVQQEMLKQMTDEAIADFGSQAEEIGRKKGILEMTKFIHEKIDSKYAARWATKWRSESTPVPVTEEMSRLREQIVRDLDLRLRAGYTIFNPSSSIEEQAEAIWNTDVTIRQEFFGNYAAWLAYRRAEVEGRVRIAGDSVIR